jgi:hypothetical protein
MIWQDNVTKMMTWTCDWMLSWHLTNGRLLKMDRKARLKVKQTYKVEMKTFKIKRQK